MAVVVLLVLRWLAVGVARHLWKGATRLTKGVAWLHCAHNMYDMLFETPGDTGCATAFHRTTQ